MKDLYHGNQTPNVWTGAGLFLTDDYETAVGYATERSFLGDTGWVHMIRLTGRIADANDLDIEIDDPTDLYNPDLHELARQAGFAAVTIEETHHVNDYRSATTMVLVDPTAAVCIGSHEITPDLDDDQQKG